SGITLTSMGLVAEHHPNVRGFEVRVDVAQPDYSDGGIVDIGSEEPDNVAAPLHRDFEPLWADELTAVPEVQPLVVFLLGKPVRDQPKSFRRIRRYELHARRTFPGTFPLAVDDRPFRCRS